MRLPMRGQVESLNASVAGSIAIYMAYLARQRVSQGAKDA
jgi:tRNA G18 (ribose-2'-O)-methylase SpoU